MQPEDSQVVLEEIKNRDDIRKNPKKSALPCGAKFCHRCHEECGVIVHAYIMRDLSS